MQLTAKHTETNCIHFWILDANNLGTCKKCGAIRQFPEVQLTEQLVIAGKAKQPLVAEGNKKDLTIQRETVNAKETMNTQGIGNSFIEDCKLRELSPKTLEGYTFHIKQLTQASPEFPPGSGVVQHLLTNVKGGKLNADGHYRTFHALGNYAERQYGIPNFMDKVVRPRVPRQIMPTISTDELGRLAIFLKEASPRDKAVVVLLVDTAIRSGEACNLKRNDIQEDRIVVHGKSGYRVAPLSPFTRELLLALPVHEDGYVFHGTNKNKNKPLGQTGFYKIVRTCLRAIGYKGKQPSPQTLRRSYGVFHLRDGGDLKSLSLILGHKNIQTTANYYTPLLDEDIILIHHKHTPIRAFAQITKERERNDS